MYRWIELPYLGIEFKRVAAIGDTLWAIGGDHQIYVCKFGVEVPIRVQEVTYENQRWNPIDGFSANLLPTDRPNFSTIDGTIARPKSGVKLPSLAWQWESEWYVDSNFNGKTLDKQGWTYAVDFPAQYSAAKGLTSCVRRRRWIRYRRYAATDSWSAVAGVHKDQAEEPFIDIAVGGRDIPNGNPEETMVWTVTVMGRVMVRQGVTASCPEGTGWLHINTPDGCEISQVATSPSGLVWAVTWNGRALVRLGVSRLDPAGTGWAEVEAPADGKSPLSHVSVGENAVWALSRDRRVWFRNGIRAASSGESESMARGTKWIEMVGELSMISVGPGDQGTVQSSSQKSES